MNNTLQYVLAAIAALVAAIVLGIVGSAFGNYNDRTGAIMLPYFGIATANATASLATSCFN